MAETEMNAAHVKSGTVLVQEPDRNRWVAKFGDRTIGALTYQFAGDRYVLISVHVDADLRHQGIATRLAFKALDDIRATGKKITVICPFVGDVLGRNPDYFDLVDPVHPGAGISGTARTASADDKPETRVGGPGASVVLESDAAPDDGATLIMVLGAVAFRGPLTEMGIGEVHREWEVGRWATISEDSIAHSVRLLAVAGFIGEERTSAGEIQLHCTGQGREELRQLWYWHFVNVLTPAELADGLRRRILYIDEVLAYESSVIAHAGVDGPAHASETVRLNWHRYNAECGRSGHGTFRLMSGCAWVGPSQDARSGRCSRSGI